LLVVNGFSRKRKELHGLKHQGSMHDWFQRATFRENVYEVTSSTMKEGVTLDNCIFYMKITFLNGDLEEQIYMQ